MQADAHRWLICLGAVVCATAAVAALLWLHQLRPMGVMELSEAEFFATAARPETSAGETVILPHDWRRYPAAGSEGWYRFELQLKVAPNRLWAVYVPAMEMTPAIFVNDVLVGGDPDPAQPLARYWQRPVFYSIPNGLLRPDNNQIDVRLAANGPWGRLTQIYLGAHDDLLPDYERRHFWRVTWLNITTVASLMLALFMAALSAVHRDSSYSWFAAFAFSWFLHNLFMLTAQVPVPNPVWDYLVYVIIGLMLSTGSIFTFRFLGERSARWERLILSTAVLGPLLLLALLLHLPTFNLVGSTLWMGILLVLATYPSFLVLRTIWQRRDIEVFFLGICYTMGVLLGLHDWLVTSGLGFRHNGLMLQFATAPTLATFGVILLRRFLAALRETQTLTRELEARVAQKAAEIDATYRENRVLESAQLLSRERERIMRDMHDGVGSQLIGMMGHLDRESFRDQALKEELNTALTDLRLMIDSLEDVENDVVVALGLFRNRIQPQLDAAGVSLAWKIDDLPRVSNLGPERVLHFMRILQEAAINSVRHSGASKLTVATRESGAVNGRSCVCVIVSDDGRGFDGSARRGRGLANMRYRAEKADLELEIRSGSGGTWVTIGFP